VAPVSDLLIEWQRQRIAALENENAGLRADLEALRAENVELHGMFARMRAEWIRQISKSLTRRDENG
jgi:hypothetical protein